MFSFLLLLFVYKKLIPGFPNVFYESILEKNLRLRVSGCLSKIFFKPKPSYVFFLEGVCSFKAAVLIGTDITTHRLKIVEVAVFT